MKIAIVCDIYGKENNGSDIVAANLIKFMQNAGHEVRIVCADQSKKGKDNYYVVPNHSFGRLADNYIEKAGVTLAKPVTGIIEEGIEGADVVHIMMPFMLGIAAAKSAVKKGIPITAGFHVQAEIITSYLKINRIKTANRFFYNYIYNRLYRYCDAIHYPTKFIRDTFEKSIGKTTPGYVISNGVHDYVRKKAVSKPDEYADKTVILTTGRYSDEKAQDVLIKAVKLSKHEKDVQLILGGQGQNEGYYRYLAKGMTNPPVFKFFSRTEIIDVINYSDIYVHPARYELEGISCMEAIACGKLTVVSDSELSATRNFAVDDKCVFRCGDERDLADKIDYFIEREDEREFYAKKYEESAANFDQRECMKRMEKMFSDVIKKSKGEDFIKG